MYLYTGILRSRRKAQAIGTAGQCCNGSKMLAERLQHNNLFEHRSSGSQTITQPRLRPSIN